MINYRNHFEKLELIKSKKLSLIDNVNFFLKQIEFNKDLNAYNSVFNEDAIEKAATIQDKILNGNHGRLAGMVIAVKDNISIENKPLTCSSKILKNFISLYSATAVNKLLNEDAIIIGKTNCDEFAMGSSNENSYFGNVLNPIDRLRVPGGSSGGSAVAVAANLCDASLGSDTGGSIRQPASYCGVYGIKPSYGRVSRYGLTAFASSFDTIGVFANSIENSALVLDVISGHDIYDSTSSVVENRPFNYDTNQNFTIGIPHEFFGEGLDSEIRKSIEEIIDKLESSGYNIKNISLPHTDYATATYYILTTAEASSNLARYDGVRYGERKKLLNHLDNMYLETRTDGFGEEVKRRIMLGTYVLSSGYYDAYYKKAQQVRRIIKNDFDQAFKSVDIMLSPTSPTTAFKIGEKLKDPLQMYLNDIYTTSANLTGIPGINIPLNNDSNGLPIGLQLMSDMFQEEKIFQLSKIIEAIK